MVNGAAMIDPGTAASRQVKARPSGTAGDQLVDEDAAGSADEQGREDRAADEPAGLADRERDHLSDEQGDEQSDAEGVGVGEDGAELVTAGEHGQREGNSDESEEGPAEGGFHDAGHLQSAEQSG